jgi:hypothetical protein
MKEYSGERQVQKNDGTERPTVDRGIDKEPSFWDKDVPDPEAFHWRHGPFNVTVYPPSLAIRKIDIPQVPGVLATKYPELYEELAAEPESHIQKKFTIGIVTIDSAGERTHQVIDDGKTPTTVLRGMRAQTENGLRSLAQQMESDPSLNQVDYLLGFSRLAHAVRHLGFDVFSDPAKLKPHHLRSITLTMKSHVLRGRSQSEAREIAWRHEPALAVMNKAKFLELYGTKTSAEDK